MSCMLCSKTFTLKLLLRRHYISHHGYKPGKSVQISIHRKFSNSFVSADLVSKSSLESTSVGGGGGKSSDEKCSLCSSRFPSVHDLIRHHLDWHSVLSGLACPYCNGCKKFDDVDAHAKKYHPWDLQSPIQVS